MTIDDCVGIDEINSGVLNVFPNPVHNSLNVALTLTKDQELTVYIMNQIGQLVQITTSCMSAGDQTITLNTEKLKAGVHFVKIISDKGLSLHKKFLKIDL